MKRTKYPVNWGSKRIKPKHEVFAREYLIDFNATRAAIAAGYSRASADVQGAKALKLKDVQSTIQRELSRRYDRIQITQDKVVEELAKIAFSDMKDFAEWGKDGVRLKDSLQLAVTQTGAVAEVSESKGKGLASPKNLRFKLYDKIKALELLGKHLGMFPDKIDVNAKVKRTDEHTYHIIQELVTDSTVAERVRANFRQRVGESISQE